MPVLLPPVHELDAEPALRFGDRELSYRELRDAAAAVAESLRGVAAPPSGRSPRSRPRRRRRRPDRRVELVPLNPKLGDSASSPTSSATRGRRSCSALPTARSTPPRRRRSRRSTSTPRAARCPPTRPRRRRHGARHLHVGHDRRAPRARCMPRRAIARTSTRSPTPGSGRARTARARPAALPRARPRARQLGPLRRGGALRHLGRFYAATRSRGAERRRRRCSSACRRCTTGSRREAERDAAIAAAACAARGCSSPAPRRCRRRPSPHRAADRPAASSSATAHRDADEHARCARTAPRRPGYVGVAARRASSCASSTTTAATLERPTTRRSARSRCAARTSSPATSTAPTRPPRRCATAGSSPATSRRATPDGYVRIVGRRSTDLIKTGGYKVGAGEIEVALLEHPAVREAAVTGGPTRTSASGSSPGSSRRTTPHPARGADRPRGQQLAPHKRPREVRFLDELPRNAMGKVVKQRLARHDRRRGAARHRAPRRGGRRPAHRAPRAPRRAVAEILEALRAAFAAAPADCLVVTGTVRSSPPATTSAASATPSTPTARRGDRAGDGRGARRAARVPGAGPRCAERPGAGRRAGARAGLRCPLCGPRRLSRGARGEARARLLAGRPGAHPGRTASIPRPSSCSSWAPRRSERAYALGVVTEIVAPEELAATVLGAAQEVLAQGPALGAANARSLRELRAGASEPSAPSSPRPAARGWLGGVRRGRRRLPRTTCARLALSSASQRRDEPGVQLGRVDRAPPSRPGRRAGPRRRRPSAPHRRDAP